MNDRDKLWAFLSLLSAILVLAITTIVLARFIPPLPDPAFKVADGAMTIMGTAFGAAALALFRTSQAQNDMASALKVQAETAAAATPATPQPVIVANNDAQPVPVAQASEPPVQEN